MSLTTPRATRSLCFLSDANVIIACHELGVWQSLLRACRVYTTDYIARNEAKYFVSARRQRQAITLGSDIEQGRLSAVSATLPELDAIHRLLDNMVLQGLDPGELEALALVKSGRIPEARFCTGDRAAIRALALMGEQGHGISLEAVLIQAGSARLVSRLQYCFTVDCFSRELTEGALDRVAGKGLRKGHRASP